MAAQVQISEEVCPDCGGDWPTRLGRHGCNYRSRSIHREAIIIDPGSKLSESIDRITGRVESEVKSSAQYQDLAGDGDVYGDTLRDVDYSIGMLKRFRREIQRLASHVHTWNDDDYCSVCGADGRA